MNLLFLLSLNSIVPLRVQKYFERDSVRQFNNIWRKHRIAYQNALCFAMQEGYASKGMNVYIKRPTNPYLISKGYYHTDNQVHLVLQDLNLDGFPRISDPQISLPLPSNVLKLEAVVSKMIIHANYVVYRNSSNIVYDLKDQDPYKISPFLFEQVQNTGQLAVTIEGCKLSSMGVTSLTGRSVALGHSEFTLHQCQFNLEIFSRGIASPPVIANYLPNSEGLDLEHLIVKRLSGELIPKLQAALFTYVNTPDVLEKKLQNIRSEQEHVFQDTTNYVSDIIRNLTTLTMKMNVEKKSLDDFCIRWNDTTNEGAVDNLLKLHDMDLSGLENLYSSHTGGPIKLASVKVYDEIVFSYLKVRGIFLHKVGDKVKAAFNFAVHIEDVEVDLEINIDSLKKKARTKEQSEKNQSEAYRIHVTGWRSIQFSLPLMNYTAAEAIITGHLLNTLPIYLKNHLSHMISHADPGNTDYKEIDNSEVVDDEIGFEDFIQTEPDESGAEHNKKDSFEAEVVVIASDEPKETKLDENDDAGEKVGLKDQLDDESGSNVNSKSVSG